MEQKVLTKTCKHCGKKISSIYKKQLDYNYKAHLLACPKGTKFKLKFKQLSKKQKKIYNKIKKG